MTLTERNCKRTTTELKLLDFFDIRLSADLCILVPKLSIVSTRGCQGICKPNHAI